MLNKTLLSSAAVILTVVGAQAADLPSKKAAPATYVKICDAYGAGFFYIPGTDTCVKLGGYVRAEYQYTPGKDVAVITSNSGTAAATALSTAVVVTTGTLPTLPSAATSPTGGTVTYLGVTNQAGAYTAVNSNTLPVAGGVTAGDRLYFSKFTPAYLTPSTAGIAQKAAGMSETGMEIRGRIDVDARSATSMGTARTFIRLRAANTSGIRNTSMVNNGIAGMADASSTGISIESAFVQWAGFTFGVAPENYAMMPSQIYGANPWAGFPNGMKQIAYTATLGGGVSATVAIEDKSDFGYSSGPSQGVYLNRLATAANLVANVRLDQAWGFAAVHGMVGNNGLTDYAGNNPSTTGGSGATGSTNSLIGAGPLGFADAYTSSLLGTPGITAIPSTQAYYGETLPGQKTFGGYAVGGTVSFKLPMIAAGDQIWFTANYAHGMLGALASAGGLSTMASASAKRLLGGIVRVDQNLMITSGNGTTATPYTIGTVNGWNVAAAMTHYWAAQWRSNFSAGYIEINPPTSTAAAYDKSATAMGAYSLPQWGKGKMWEVAGSLIYSPAKDFDIGVELQYANIKNAVQNTANAVAGGCAASGCTTALTGTALTINPDFLKNNNISAKLRVERSF